MAAAKHVLVEKGTRISTHVVLVAVVTIILLY